MTEIGEIALKAAKNVKKSEWTKLDELFPKDERLKTFEVKSQVEPDSPIRIKIDKLGELETKAWCYPPIPLTPKSTTALQWITHADFRSINVMAAEDIMEGENLKAVFETA